MRVRGEQGYRLQKGSAHSARVDNVLEEQNLAAARAACHKGGGRYFGRVGDERLPLVRALADPVVGEWKAEIEVGFAVGRTERDHV